jgi:hypothetical protein
MQIIGWAVFVAMRILTMILILVIAYLGFVSLFYFTVLCLASFIVALFLNALLDRERLDLAVQILIWIYFLPFLELLISLNVSVIQGFFSEVLSNLDFETITKALTMPREAEHRLLILNRLGRYFYYFGAMVSMFVICLFAPGSDLASHVGLVFASIWLVVPLSAAVRPIVGAWSILLFDRTELEIPESESTSRDPESETPSGGRSSHPLESPDEANHGQDGFSESPDEANEDQTDSLELLDEAKDGQDRFPDSPTTLTNEPNGSPGVLGDARDERTGSDESADLAAYAEHGLSDAVDEDPECRVACQTFIGPHTLPLVDPIGLLSDNTWLDFLRSGFTGHARPSEVDGRVGSLLVLF